MLVRCNDCNRHYDDSFQSSNCGVPGKRSHEAVRSSPLEDHIANVRAAWGQHRAAAFLSSTPATPETPAAASGE